MKNRQANKTELGSISIAMFVIELVIVLLFYSTSSKHDIFIICLGLVEIVGIVTGLIGIIKNQYKSDLAVKGLILNLILPTLIVLFIFIMYIELSNQPLTLLQFDRH